MADNDTEVSAPAVTHDDIEEAIQYAKKYLEDLLSFYGLNIDVHATTEDEEVIELDIPSTRLNAFLIGQHGDTMRSLQFLVGSALKNNGYRYSRVNVDVAEYKKQRADRLAETAAGWIATVRHSGEPMDLKPMNAADRRTIHRVAAEAGIVSESTGEGRDRHIVLKPAEEEDSAPDTDIEASSNRQTTTEEE